jgi:hypothetical protein
MGLAFTGENSQSARSFKTAIPEAFDISGNANRRYVRTTQSFVRNRHTFKE